MQWVEKGGGGGGVSTSAVRRSKDPKEIRVLQLDQSPC